MQLDTSDLFLVRQKLPSWLVKAMQGPRRVFIGGGFIRAIVSREEISDIDLFVSTEDGAQQLANDLRLAKPDLVHRKTDNAITLYGWRWPIQIITRWLFEKPEDLINSFDFTICQTAIYWAMPTDGKAHWEGICGDRFYLDLAAKRLTYTSPVRKEDAGGSLLRLLKYYRRGYTAPLSSTAAIVARLIQGVDFSKHIVSDEKGMAMVLGGLLREVDPLFDPDHIIHDPSGPEPTE